MSTKYNQSITIEGAVDALNHLLSLAPRAVDSVLETRVEVDNEMISHLAPLLKVDDGRDEAHYLGALGLINALFANFDDQPMSESARGPIFAIIKPNGALKRFQVGKKLEGDEKLALEAAQPLWSPTDY